ncbi:MAG: zinc-ribbon domain-containing protein [Pirellulaceae bacterium]|jgi:ribosomal protein L37E|nr:zinc-ribbon domain-containing protein [Pirellulaceae bacterium]
MPAAAGDDSFDRLDDPDDDELDDKDTATIACPHCGAEIYEAADQCPACGMFVMPDTRVWSGKSVWWIALGVLGVVAALLALVLGL